MIMLHLSLLLVLSFVCAVSSVWGPDSEPRCQTTAQCKDFQVCVSSKCQCVPNYRRHDTIWDQCQHYQCQTDQDCYVHDTNHVCNKNKYPASCECSPGYLSNTSGVYCHKSTLGDYCDWEEDCHSDAFQNCEHLSGTCSCIDGYHDENGLCRPGTLKQPSNSNWYIYALCFGVVAIVAVAGCFCWRRRVWKMNKRAEEVRVEEFPRQTFQQPPTLNIPRSPSTFETEPQQAFRPFIISPPYTNVNYPGQIPVVQFNEPPPSYESINPTPCNAYQASTIENQRVIASHDQANERPQTSNKTISDIETSQNQEISPNTTQSQLQLCHPSPTINKQEQLSLQL